LSVYGLLWMVGMLAGLRVHAHVVEGAGLRVGNGVAVDVVLAWDQTAAVRPRLRSLEGMRNIQVHDVVLSLGVGSQTTVDVVLREPVVLPVRASGGEPVPELRLHADEARGLVARVRHALTLRSGSGNA
jgi:hypothetical protein